MEEINIQQLVQDLLRTNEGEFGSYITEVKTNLEVADTKAVSHCYFVNLDGNGRPRINDFARFVAQHIVDYSIPRKEIEEARDYDQKHGTTVKMMQLGEKARGLFTDLTKSGEGGEMLLYMLVQEFLKFPQLICKMPLKTNPNMHYHGADGLHISAEANAEGKEILALYWGESKLYKDVSNGIDEAVKSLKEFLLSDGAAGSPAERDLQLVQDNINVIDEKLENALVRYLDKDDPLYNQLIWRGICLVGFDSDKYPSIPNSGETLEKIREKIEQELPEWSKKVGTNISKHTNLNTFDIHVFLIPFPSVEEFRASFLAALGIKNEPAPENL